jgi:hypothetical protein
VARLLGLFQAGTGRLIPVPAAPLLTHAISRVRAVHHVLAAGEVLVGDRGFCSYAHLALLVQAHIRAVCRLGARQITDVTPHRPFVLPGAPRTPASKGLPRSRWLKSLGATDQLVEGLKPRTCPSWLTQQECEALPPSLVVRELRYTVSTPGFRARQITLVTTLLNAEVYSLDNLAALYRTRWQVEMHLAQLKTTMKMDILPCNTVPGVLKELTVFAIVDNVVRMVMRQAAMYQQVAVERISFLDALRWLGAPGTGMGWEAWRVNPARPHRVETRVQKRRRNRFPPMVKPRHELRKSVIQQSLRA